MVQESVFFHFMSREATGGVAAGWDKPWLVVLMLCGAVRIELYDRGKCPGMAAPTGSGGFPGLANPKHEKCFVIRMLIAYTIMFTIHFPCLHGLNALMEIVLCLTHGMKKQGFIMSDPLNNHVLLTADEVAALLQPFMRNKSALDWLANDRLRTPAIPFFVLQEEIYYRESDVIDFVRHVLSPSAHFVHVHNHLIPERREPSDRRSRHGDRRRKEAIALQPGIERRRWGQPDRRLQGDLNRRAQVTPYFW
ncbi:MAG: hypothetical protein Q7V00_11735 [Sulfurimicrobium sp.]|nr:hypothetical protein [Sulfurimicrobium sp.]MDP1704899.1 hypothetical protein [Sulfurimicrobium sp.]MDP2198294.1 hypothetical protein [Sulfurimicrobium sp.]MDP3688529.1 hypothetical protein [Sulfurimicrobium sp.]